MQLNKDIESKKGYWMDDEPRGLLIKVLDRGTDDVDGARISLSSEYWYRVQHFDLDNTSPFEAWKMIRTVMKECGRTLVPHQVDIAIDLAAGVDPDQVGEQQETECERAAQSHIQYYRIAYLNCKQVDQLYYLLKHSLTTAGVPIQIGHTLGFDKKKPCVALPPKRRRKRRRNNNRPHAWQVAGPEKP